MPATVPAGGCDPPTGGRLPSDAEHGHSLELELGGDFPGRTVPDLDWRSDGRRCDSPVGAQRDAANRVVVPGERQAFLTVNSLERGGVPDADSFVGARGGEAMAVRAEGHAAAPAGVSVEAEHLPAGGGFP